MQSDMDIACPNCAATYRVPDSLLASGKPLRCVACKHLWVPLEPPTESLTQPAPPAPPFRAAPPPVAPAPPVDLPQPQAETWSPAPALPEPALPEPASPELWPTERLPPERLPTEAWPDPAPEPLPPPAPQRPLKPTEAVPPPLLRRGPPHLGAQRAVATSAKARPSRMALTVAWLASVMVVAIFVLALLLYRLELAQAWPPFARVAGLIGG